MIAKRPAASIAMLALGLATACSQLEVVAIPLPQINTRDAGTDAGSADAGRADAGSANACAYRMQTVQTAANGGNVSLSQLSRDAFGRALCTCNAFSSSASLQVDGFDHAHGAYVADAGNASIAGDVAVNGELSLDGLGSISGALSVAGVSGVSLTAAGDFDVGAALDIGGPLEGSAATVRVGSDARVDGRVELGGLTVPGTLTQPSGSSLRVSGTRQIGQQRSADVSITPACACDATTLLDIGAIVSVGMTDAQTIGADATLDDERCKEYVLPMHTVDTWHVRASSSAAIYVPGGLHVMQDFVVDTTNGAQLDIFIENELSVDGHIALGNDTGNVRLYIGGAGTLQLTGGGELHAALYAPRGELVLRAPLTVYGGVFIRRMAASADIAIHYDAALARDP